MQAGHVPGLALAAVQDGEIVYARGFGVASVETGQPVTPDTLFRIGSITKSMTATAVMRLVEAGKLDLDRPVREYVPRLTFSDPRAPPSGSPSAGCSAIRPGCRPTMRPTAGAIRRRWRPISASGSPATRSSPRPASCTPTATPASRLAG